MHVNSESFREKEQLRSKREIIVVKMKSLNQAEMSFDCDTGQF